MFKFLRKKHPDDGNVPAPEPEMPYLLRIKDGGEYFSAFAMPDTPADAVPPDQDTSTKRTAMHRFAAERFRIAVVFLPPKQSLREINEFRHHYALDVHDVFRVAREKLTDGTVMLRLADLVRGMQWEYPKETEFMMIVRHQESPFQQPTSYKDRDWL